MVKKILSKKIEKTAKQYLEILKKDGLPIQKAIIFGSWAKGSG